MRLCYFVIMLGLFCVMIYSFLHFDKKLYKTVVFSTTPIFLVLLFLGNGYHTREPNINEGSLNCVGEYLTKMDSSDYKFETETVSGTISIFYDSENGNNMSEYLYTKVKTKEGVTSNGIKYVFSPVVVSHNPQFWNLYYPTGATGEICICFKSECILIDYLYIGENPYDFLNGIIDPTYFYCPEINVEDILSNAVVSEDKGYYG